METQWMFVVKMNTIYSLFTVPAILKYGLFHFPHDSIS